MGKILLLNLYLSIRWITDLILWFRVAKILSILCYKYNYISWSFCNAFQFLNTLLFSSTTMKFMEIAENLSQLKYVPSVVLDPSLSSTSLLFLLLDSLNLGSLTSDLTSTSQGAVNFTSLQQYIDVNGQVVQQADTSGVLQDGAGTGKADGTGFNSLNLSNLNIRFFLGN